MYLKSGSWQSHVAAPHYKIIKNYPQAISRGDYCTDGKNSKTNITGITGTIQNPHNILLLKQTLICIFIIYVQDLTGPLSAVAANKIFLLPN